MSAHPKTRMPVLFIGHGSPMNALADNDFTRSLNRVAATLPKPRAIVCVSAHWMTDGIWVTQMPWPKTIHDFYGFPQELFNVQYPAPGSPEIAEWICREFSEPSVKANGPASDQEWGLDHGTWSVVKHLYPKADVPIIQMSLDLKTPAATHFNLGRQLAALRDQGVLIIGSGNIVHNLRLLRFELNAPAYDWAQAFDQWFKDRLEARDYTAIVECSEPSAKLSVPTPEHWFPVLYTLGAADPTDALETLYEGIDLGSISMRTFKLG